MTVQHPFLDASSAPNPAVAEATSQQADRNSRFVDKEGTAVSVRPYEPADRAGLETMYEEFDSAFCAQGVPPVSPVRRANWLEMLLEDGVHFVAALEGAETAAGNPTGRIVGHSLYTPRTHPEPELAVFVHQAFHGRGIGTELCRRLIATAAERGHEAIVLDVERRNVAAVSLYRKLGFETAGDYRRELHMRLALSGTDEMEPGEPTTVDG